MQELHGSTFFRFGDHLWEVTPWMPGEADFHAAPTQARLCSAMEALAQFHLAIAAADVPSWGPSPGMASRLGMTLALRDGRLGVLSAAAAAGEPSPLTILARELIGAAARLVSRCLPHLEAAAQIRVPLQFCIRDIWHDHVLFTREEVTGIVDFGSMRSETVAGDLARLLGSFLGDQRSKWQFAVEHYRRFRPLTNNEICLLWAFDVGNVLLSGLQWVEWVFVQQRVFADMPSIQRRMQENLRRLRCLLEHDGRPLNLRT
jgi:Ser/Thr protein kinase RdoA (MazF antagonist)